MPIWNCSKKKLEKETYYHDPFDPYSTPEHRERAEWRGKVVDIPAGKEAVIYGAFASFIYMSWRPLAVLRGPARIGVIDDAKVKIRSIKEVPCDGTCVVLVDTESCDSIGKLKSPL